MEKQGEKQEMKRCGLWTAYWVLSVLASGCATEPMGCLGVVLPAVVVIVADSRTGELLQQISGFIEDGDYVDSLVPRAWYNVVKSWQAGLGRPGKYDVQVDHPGYQTWRVEGVAVKGLRCGLETAEVRAELVSS